MAADGDTTLSSDSNLTVNDPTITDVIATTNDERLCVPQAHRHEILENSR